MQIFGITLNRYSVPIIYLACAIVSFLLIRESVHMFQHPIATRAISIFLGVGFMALSLPALWANKTPLPAQARFLLIIWLASTLLSTLLGNQPWPAMMRWFEILVSIGIALCLYFIINKQPKLINLIAKAIVAAVLLCLLAFITYWNLLADPTIHNWATDIPFFMNIRHFGQLIAVAVPLGYFLLHQKTLQQQNKYGVIGYLILSWALVFWLGGRGTFLAVTVVTIIFGFIAKEQLKWLIISPLIGLIISLFFVVDNPSLNLFRFAGQENVTINTMSSSRMDLYIDSLIHWWTHNPILGIGADGFRYIVPAIIDKESMAHPHNIFIQLLLSYGPVGLLIPCYFFFVLTHKVISQTRTRTRESTKKNTSAAFYLIFLSTMILAIFDGILYHAYGLFISAIIAGISIALVWPLPQPYCEAEIEAELEEEKLEAELEEATRSHVKTTLIAALIALTSLGYCLVFTYQLYSSKYTQIDEQWIHWNARYPIYFSPTWSYQRFDTRNMELQKEIFIERITNVKK